MKKNLIISIPLIILTYLSYIHIISTLPFPAGGFLPEYILEYIGAKNYIDYGFLKNWLILDYSPSPLPEDHPYLYTHQLGLPSLIIAILLKLEFTLTYIRLFFSIISILGLLYFYRILIKTTNDYWISLLLFLVFLSGYNQTFIYLDHFTHAFYYVCFFGGTYSLINYLEAKKNLNLIIYLFYLTLSLVTNILCFFPLLVASIFIAYYFGSFKKLLGPLLISVVIMLFLILTRNMLYFGPKIAFLDIIYTISNRVTGIPNRFELLDFYRTNGIVLWGVSIINGENFINWIKEILFNPLKVINIFLISFVVINFYFNKTKIIFNDFKLLVLILISTFSWHIIFLAQGSIYTWPFLNKMVYVIFTGFIYYNVKFILLNQKVFIQSITGLNVKKEYKLISILVILACLISFLSFSKNILNLQNYNFKKSESITGIFDENLYSKENPHPLIYTNLDGVVGSYFLPGAKVVGGCTSLGMIENKIELCPSTFLRSQVGHGDYVLFGRQFIGGSSDCTDFVCLEAFQKKLDNELEFVAQNKYEIRLYKIR